MYMVVLIKKYLYNICLRNVSVIFHRAKTIIVVINILNKTKLQLCNKQSIF